MDARNHGDSPHSPLMSYEAMTEDLIHFLSTHSIEKCSLLGHSMGGKVAMTTALRQPDMVDRLVVVDVAPTCTSGTQDMLQYIAALRSLDLRTVRKNADADQALSEDIPVSSYCSMHACGSFVTDLGP